MQLVGDEFGDLNSNQQQQGDTDHQRPLGQGEGHNPEQVAQTRDQEGKSRMVTRPSQHGPDQGLCLAQRDHPPQWTAAIER